jgi:hypothetical protein
MQSRALVLAGVFCTSCLADVDSSYEAVQLDDPREQNDSFLQATLLDELLEDTDEGSVVELPMLIAANGDADYFRFTLDPNATFEITIEPQAPVSFTLWYEPSQDGVPPVEPREQLFSTTFASGPSTVAPNDVSPVPRSFAIKVQSVSGMARYSLELVQHLDEDGDEIEDVVDNCANTFNPDQSDHDDDGQGDECDTDCLGLTNCLAGGEDNVCQALIHLPEGSVPIYRTLPLQDTHECITRAIVYVHGTSRQPWLGFASLINSAIRNGELGNTIIIAPWFQEPEDDPEGLYWVDDWAVGGGAGQFPLVGVSSFEVMDAILEDLADANDFPNLNEIILTGHSGGGQFTQRYAAGGLGPNELPSNISMRFMPANPGSYMLFEPLEEWGIFDVNEFFGYRYGLFDRNAYMERLTTSEAYYPSSNPLVQQYLDREVTLLIGSADVCNCDGEYPGGYACNNSNLPCEDAAQAQGAHRLERAYTFFDQLESHYDHNTELVEIPNVGHSSNDIYSCGDAPLIMFGPPGVTQPSGCN